MSNDYSLLKDEYALKEIRKHKWLESEKCGREIGFATAALDWITQYSDNFLRYRFEPNQRQDPFIEQRRYRRIPWQSPIAIQLGNEEYLHTQSIDMNFQGFSCQVPQYLAEDSKIKVSIDMRGQGYFSRRSKFYFNSIIQKITKIKKDRFRIDYKAFIPFSDEVRDYLRLNANSIIPA